MKQVPNILSLCRIGFSLALLLATDSPVAFVALYLLCGITDVLDGTLARRFHMESKPGAKLDSIGDFVFWAIVLYLLFFKANIEYSMGLIMGVIVIVVLRAVNFLITRIRFRVWGMLHSWGNKATGLLLFILLPVCLATEKIAAPVGILLCAAGVLSALDEMAVLLSSREYDANRKGFFIK